MSHETIAVSPHPLATKAGQDILDAGGTAAEAAITINAVLAVVFPHFCGLGGDAVWLLSDGKGADTCLMGIGQAIEAAPQDGEAIPTRGAGSVLTTAAVVDSWQNAMELWNGTFTVSQLLTPAIELAQTGFPISASQDHWLNFRNGETQGWPGFDTVFRPNGQTLATGDTLRQPHLAESLKSLVTDGLRSFYDGPLADKIIAGLNAAGAPMSHVDLERTHARFAEPLKQTYRGLTLLAPPPPTQGLTTLQIMGILENFDLASLADEDSADHFHLVVEAVKRAFRDRKQIADPDCSHIDTTALLNSAHLANHAADIGPDALPWPDKFAPADTVYFGAVDAEGRCVSALQSTYFDWGSGVIAGDTSILWQNRGAAFDPNPAHINGIAPGKRPFYTLNPGIALSEGKARFLYGTQGADGQPQTLAMLLTRLIDYKKTPTDALAGARFLLGRTFSDSNDTLKLEGHVKASTSAELQKRGHEVANIPRFSPLAGQAGIIQVNADNTVDGAHDPRGAEQTS